MGLDFNEGVTVIMQGTTDIIAQFWPFMAAIVGIYLAFEIMGWIAGFLLDILISYDKGIPLKELREVRREGGLVDRDGNRISPVDY